MSLRKLSKIASIGMAVLGLVVVPPLRAFQAEDATKAVTKKARKSAKDATSNAASSDTNTTNKPVEKTSSADTAQRAKSAPANTVSESEISAAKADGKVWVNTESGVYHKGGQWYGATKQGKFMTEQEAKQAGYRAAKSK
jgi:cytoskeletal protein RodZ